PADDAGVDDVDAELWRRTLEVNVVGAAIVSAAALRHMGPGSAIVNVSSFVALLGSVAPQPAYAASKGALLAWTREAAVALAPRQIRVNAVCPGPLDTPLLPAALHSEGPARSKRLDRIPLGRFGVAEEVAPLVAFLLSDS